MFGDCHAPCALKTSFVDFERVGALYCYKNLNFSSLLSIRWQSKVIDPVGPSLHSFLYSFYTPIFKTGRIMVYQCPTVHLSVRPSVCPSFRFTCRALTEEPLGQFTSNFTELLELMVLRSVYFMVKFRIFIPELWDFIHQIVGDFSYVAL